MKHRQEKLRNNNMKKYYFLFLFPGQLITFQSFRPKNCITVPSRKMTKNCKNLENIENEIKQG